jgi:type IV secretion system protein VirB10
MAERSTPSHRPRQPRGSPDGYGADAEVNPHEVAPPLSPFEITTGTIIPAVLLTEANSDLPGLLTARVRENVYDSATGEHLLIPQGTVITGAYDSVVTYGQERLLVAWQRLLFPDGTKLNLGSMPGVDALGAAGFEDQVNHHYLRIFGGATLLSVISAGLQISQGGADYSNTTERQNLTDTLGAALGQNLGEAASQLIRRNLNVQPKIEIRSGYRFNVFVRKDLVFRGPYGQA